MDVLDQLDVILPQVRAVAAQVTPADYDKPTPCAAFTVRDLFDHMIGGASAFAPQLRGEAPRAYDPSSIGDEDRPRLLADAMDELLDAAKSPGALGRTVQLPFGAVPGAVLARFLTLDGMVHAWDMSQATGREYRPDEALAEQVLATAHELIAPEMRDGDTFAAEAPAPDDADAVTRLAAFTGRRV